jgi:hypothetical protein
VGKAFQPYLLWLLFGWSRFRFPVVLRPNFSPRVRHSTFTFRSRTLLVSTRHSLDDGIHVNIPLRNLLYYFKLFIS